MTVAVRIVLAAGIYWLAGRLALLMAIPPGYATAVWPAAGLALVMVLVWGRPAAIGVALGSCLVNIATSFDGSSTLTLIRSVTPVLLIGTGAALQASFGSWIIRRYVGFPTGLEDEKRIVQFTVFGGPVACLVNATVGVTSLCGFGVIQWDNYLYSWWTWWVGDSIGTLIFAPLTLLFLPSEHTAWRRRRTIVGVPLVCGFIIVTVLFWRASSWESTRLHNDFNRRAVPVADALKKSLTSYESVSSFVAAFIDASPHLTRTHFNKYAQQIRSSVPGILAIEWAPVVTELQRPEFEAREQAEGILHFQIQQREQNGTLQRASERSVYVPLHYIDPQQPNIYILGFDLASDAKRHAALQNAATKKKTTATGIIPLVVQDKQDTPGLLIFSPLATANDTTADHPFAGVLGFSVVVIKINDVIKAVSRPISSREIDLTLVDITRVAANSNDNEVNYRWQTTFDFGDRRWQIAIRATDYYMTKYRSWQAWMVLAAGLLFVGLLGTLLLVTTGRSEQIQRVLQQLHTLNMELEERVQQRTTELSSMLKERDILLQEIHHRVKNNLQIIASLINMQVRRLGAGESRMALEECRMRVSAIALIHEKLYRSKDYAEIPFSDYVQGLASIVFDALGAQARAVSLELAITPVSLRVDQAIPCGLILNELITNAVKHAFVDSAPGTIRVELNQPDHMHVRLKVSDNGIGFPAHFDVESAETLGMQLITTLSEQLGATRTLKSDRGASIEFVFSKEHS